MSGFTLRSLSIVCIYFRGLGETRDFFIFFSWVLGTLVFDFFVIGVGLKVFPQCNLFFGFDFYPCGLIFFTAGHMLRLDQPTS